ncbi:MAG: hypothetical protein WAK61_01225 [Leclercia sp.]
MKPTFEELLEHAKMNAKSGESLCPEEELDLIAGFEAKCQALAAENAALKSVIDEHSNCFTACQCCGTEHDCSHDDICRVLNETPATDAFLAEVRAQEAVTIPDEPAGSAMYDLFYQTEHPVCRGNVQLARSEARSLASWIAENLKLRQEAAR